MRPYIPSPAEVAYRQARILRDVAFAQPGSPFQLQLLTAAAHLGQQIAPVTPPPLTAEQQAILADHISVISTWTDVHFQGGPFSAAILALTPARETEAA